MRTARLRHGFTLRDVGRELSCSHVWVNDLENGRRKLPLEWALKLATLYGVSIGYIANGDRND